MKLLYLDPCANSHFPSYYQSLFLSFRSLISSSKLINPFSKKRLLPPPSNCDTLVLGYGFFSNPSYRSLKLPRTSNHLALINKPQSSFQSAVRWLDSLSPIPTIITPSAYILHSANTNVPVKLIPYGFDHDLFFPAPMPAKLYHIGFSGALHSSMFYPSDAFANPDLRQKIKALLDSQFLNLRIFWNASDSKTNYLSRNQYVDLIGSSRVWIATLAAYQEMTARYLDVLPCGTVLLC